MLGMYLYQRFLNKMDDYNFERYWEDKVLKRQRMYFILLLVYFFVALGLITEVLLIGNESIFFALLVIGLTFVLYGGYFLRRLLRFIGENNARFLQVKTGYYNETSTFSKDNVVG